MPATKKRAKRTAAKAAPRTRKKTAPYAVENSFMIVKDRGPFMTFKITDQTIYWLILAIVVLLLAFWVLKIQMDVSDLLDNIQASL